MLQMKEEDVLKFLAAGTHLGGTNMDFQMEHYVYKRKCDGEFPISTYKYVQLMSIILAKRPT